MSIEQNEAAPIPPPGGLQRSAFGTRAKIAIGSGVALLVAAAVFVQVTGFGSVDVTPAACQPALAEATSLEPLSVGDAQLFRPALASSLLTDLSFVDGDGHPTTLAAFAGKTVLVNFWATWCVPCRMEMPALDKLQAEMGSDKFQVVAVNMDTAATADQEKAFLASIGVQHLAFYADPSLTLTQQLQDRSLVDGLPTTLLVNPQGCRLGLVEGGVAWDSPDAKALIAKAISS